jgi:GNAT superfamily N-acetyltransferase
MKVSGWKATDRMPDLPSAADECHEAICIRPASGADAAAMLPLIRSHAAYEKGQARVGEADLRSALGGAAASLVAWVAMQAGELVGYASAMATFSTWAGHPFLYLDCLFVHEHHRGKGIGAKLLAAVRTYAAEHDLAEVQWQTPDWNEDAIRFYHREGASSLLKARFTLPAVVRITAPQRMTTTNIAKPFPES